MLQLLVFFVLVAVVVETFWAMVWRSWRLSTRDLLLVTFLVSIICGGYHGHLSEIMRNPAA